MTRGVVAFGLAVFVRAGSGAAQATGASDAADAGTGASTDAGADASTRAGSDAERLQALEDRLRALEGELAQRRAESGTSTAPTEIASAVQGTSHPSTPAELTLSGYAEVFYQWNFNRPSNGITNERGFDNRHDTFTLSNVVLDASGSLGPVTARLALQFGHTPETYYLAEPASPGTSSAGSTDANTWKFLQQANVGWRTPLGRGLLLEAGLFLSPVGPEGLAVHEQWNWSRSNLFFGLPFYHTGARVSYPFTDHITATLAVYNGWNSVVDNNLEKSISAALDYVVTDRVTFHVLYFGGVERPTGAPERQNGTVPWRNLFDAYLALYPKGWFSLLVHANAGFEPTAFGTAWWAAGAAYGRAQLASWLYLALRADFFYERVPANSLGTASPIFWPSPWVASQTATLDARPQQNLSVRLEYRHDQAAGDTYFQGAVTTDPTTGAFILNARAQDTLTLGVTAWF